MSALKHIFEKYLGFPSTSDKSSRKRKSQQEEEDAADHTHRSKVRRVVAPTAENTFSSRFLPNAFSSFIHPRPPLSSTGFNMEHQPPVSPIEIESESEIEDEMLGFLSTRRLTPNTFKRYAGRRRTEKAMPGLIPCKMIQSQMGYNDRNITNGHNQKPKSTFNFDDVPKLNLQNSASILFKNDMIMGQKDEPRTSDNSSVWRKSICHRPPVPALSRAAFMVNTARRNGYNLEEKLKYGSILNQLSPSINPKSSANFRFPKKLSLFNGNRKEKEVNIELEVLPKVIKANSPFPLKENVSSANKYSALLQEFSKKFDKQTKELFQRKVSKPVGFIDLTVKDGPSKQPLSESVVLTDDEDDEADIKIPKRFPYLNRQRSPCNDDKIVITDDDDDFDQTTNRSKASSFSNSSFRKKEKIEPVNTLLDDLQQNPMFQDGWLEKTKKRYSQSQEERSRLINQELENSRQIELEGKHEVQDMIKKLDETLLFSEVIVIEDEEEAAARAREPQDVPLPAFTGEQVEKIRFAMARGRPDEVLNTKFNISITRRDISTLIGDAWLNDEVINFYMNLLMERSSANGVRYPKVYAMNTFFLPKVLQTGQSGVRRWTRKVDIFTYDIIPVPVHVSNIHWCMAIIHFKEKAIRYYDSMGHPNRPVLDALEQYLKDESLDKRQKPFDMTGWTKQSISDCPRQMNGSDCGVFSCMFAEYISRNHRINFSQDNMPYFRQKMILEIFTGQLLL